MRGITDKEARRRRAKGAGKEKHPIAAIEKRVIHSAAFADLAPSSVVVLLLLACNLPKDRNGHIQLSEAEAARHGVERKTLRRALLDLQAHGFIAKTKHGGKMQGQCHKWALTWLPVKHREGLGDIYLERFKEFAYDDWQKKIQGEKCPLDSAQNVPLKAIHSPKMSLTQGTKRGSKYLYTNSDSANALSAHSFLLTAGWRVRPDWIAAELARLARCGLAGQQSFQIPPRRTLQ